MYVDLGLPLDRLKRRLMCIWRAIRENNDGHTWHPIEVAQVAIAQHITGVPNAAKGWAHAVRLGVKAGWLTTRQDKAGKWFLAEKKAADNEGIIARKLGELLDTKPRLTWPDPDTLDVGDSDHQREIAGLVFEGNVGILAGTPGTGKSTLAAAIIKSITGEHGREFTAVIAPTGKAAVRMEEGLNARGLSGIMVGTIHRILGVSRNGNDGDGWGFLHDENNPLPFDLIVIDESSMVDVDTLASLLKAISRGTLVLFVGDPYQLPPVGHGAPLRDMIAAKLPYGELTEVRRNDGEIVQVCRRIKSGERVQPPARIDIANGRNWAHFQLGTEAQIRMKLVHAIRSLAGVELRPGEPINPVWDTQVIVALNDKGELNRKAVSEALQAILNPDGEQCEGNPFRVGDKVICTSNAWLKLLTEDADDFGEPDDDEGPQDFVANGEIGQVVAITKKHTDVRFASPARTVRVPRGGKNGNFELGYAITFHKSQGSQWPVVILLADPSANRMASRELWYTGISRAETLVVTIGQLATVARQCRRVALVDRKTFLVDRIREETDSLTWGDE
jgi:exodeoxyribonuclease V alpha subunit